MWGHYGSRIVESFQGLLVRCQAQLSISFGGIGFLFMEDYAPSIFLGSSILAILYLCSRLSGRRAHICFNHVYVQHGMTFLL